MLLRTPSLILKVKSQALLLLAVGLIMFGPNKALSFQQEETGVDYNEYSGEVKEESSNKSLVFATLTV